MLPALCLGGCAASSGIGKAETEAAFPTQSPAQIEAELKKDPKAWAEYQAAQKRDAAYQNEGR